jgi:hypothetical protein
LLEALLLAGKLAAGCPPSRLLAPFPAAVFLTSPFAD